MDTEKWTQVGRFRDVVVHSHFGLNEDVIWEIVDVKVPASLLAALSQPKAERA